MSLEIQHSFGPSVIEIIPIVITLPWETTSLTQYRGEEFHVEFYRAFFPGARAIPFLSVHVLVPGLRGTRVEEITSSALEGFGLTKTSLENETWCRIARLFPEENLTPVVSKAMKPLQVGAIYHFSRKEVLIFFDVRDEDGQLKDLAYDAAQVVEIQFNTSVEIRSTC